MTLKTPEQVADEQIEINADSILAGDEAWFRDQIIAAIEADRAQPRDELRVTLPSDQTIIVWIGTSGADGSALVQIDTADAEGNVRVFVNDGDDPIYDENPETGRYENMLECAEWEGGTGVAPQLGASGMNTDKDGELDLGEIDPGAAPGSRVVPKDAHPWAPSQLDEYEK